MADVTTNLKTFYIAQARLEQKQKKKHFTVPLFEGKLITYYI